MSRLLNLPGTSTPAVTEPGCRLRSGVREQDVLPAGSECGGQAVALSPGPWGVLSLQGCWVLLWALDRRQPPELLWGLTGRQVGPQQGCFSSAWALGPLSILGQVARWREQSARAVLGLGWRSALLPGGRRLGQAPVPALVSQGWGRGRQSCPHCRPDAHHTRRGPCPHILPPGPMGSPAGQREAAVQPGKAWLCTRAGPQPGTGGAGDGHVGEQMGPRQGCLGGLPRGGSQASCSQD